MKVLYATIIALTFGISLHAQVTSLPQYSLHFQYRSAQGVVKDTMLSRVKFKYWSRTASFPSFVKWYNQPFAICRSQLSGVGLFTDSVSSFSNGSTVGYNFFKVGQNGSFELDYSESGIGSFINDSDNPNMNVSLTAQGVVLTANQNIAPNTELTVSYQAIINLFPNDNSVKKAIQYW